MVDLKNGRGMMHIFCSSDKQKNFCLSELQKIPCGETNTFGD